MRGDQSDGAVTITAEPLAVKIEEAARMVGMSRSQFYRVFLTTKRIKPIPKGRRRRMIDVKELRSAYELYVAETREGQADE